MGKTKKHVKFFEFLTVFSTAIGITIGIGIYLKNDTSEGHVLYFTQNPYLAIGLWVLVGNLGMAMIMVFIEGHICQNKKWSWHSCIVGECFNWPQSWQFNIVALYLFLFSNFIRPFPNF
ncbi:hypothetical protein [Spiroplasma endosymbiont of Polydrusus pterygomalis]|uniref:hypothetical protein n=1 Tax=Spiroplasma endosymbiont of Polydrusus pterygomalis TaxID=3139327 RepID=UPI003CCB53AF